LFLQKKGFYPVETKKNSLFLEEAVLIPEIDDGIRDFNGRNPSVLRIC